GDPHIRDRRRGAGVKIIHLNLPRPPELEIRVPLGVIARFAMHGEVYRAYAHAIAADQGMVLLVPIELVNGDLTGLIDGCPVPWEEVTTLIEAPDNAPRPLLAHVDTVLGRPLLELAPSHWDVD